LTDVKHVIWIPLGLLLTAAVAALVLRQVTGSYHGQEVGFAVGITLVSAELAMIPLAMTRRLGPVANFQAAFGGTLMHLFLCLAAGAAVYALQLAGDRNIYVFLLLGFYWFSLVFVVIAMARVFRRTMPTTAAVPGPAAGAKHA
jgi:hypothetical protein